MAFSQSTMQKLLPLILYSLTFLPFLPSIKEYQIVGMVALGIYFLYTGLSLVNKQNTIRTLLIVPILCLAMISYFTMNYALFYPLGLFPYVISNVDDELDDDSPFEKYSRFAVCLGAFACFMLGSAHGSIMDKMGAYAPLIFVFCVTGLHYLINAPRLQMATDTQMQEEISSLENEVAMLQAKLKNAKSGLTQENYLAAVLGLDFTGFNEDETIEKTIDTLKSSAKAIFISYFDYDEKEKAFVMRKSIGSSPMNQQKTIPAGIGIVGQTYTTEQYVFVNDLQEKEKDEYKRALLGDLNAILALPIVLHGEVKASISIGLPAMSKQQELDVINLCSIIVQKLGNEFEKMEQHEKTKIANITDGLTKLYNRKYFDIKIAEAFRQAELEQKTLAYVEIDLDFFKQMNDTHGHEFGDKVLQTAAETFKENIRKSDYAFRQGGDEFCLLLMGADQKKTHEIMKKIRTEYAKKVEQYHLYAMKDGQEVKSSFSMGAAIYPNEKIHDVKSFMALADKAVYYVKEHGKNNMAIAK